MEKKRFERVFFLCSGLASATMTVAACSADVATSPGGGGSALSAMCEEFQTQIISAATRDGIPSLTDPELVAPDSPWVEFLLPTGREILHYLIPREGTPERDPEPASAWSSSTNADGPALITWATPEIEQALVGEVPAAHLMELARNASL